MAFQRKLTKCPYLFSQSVLQKREQTRNMADAHELHQTATCLTKTKKGILMDFNKFFSGAFALGTGIAMLSSPASAIELEQVSVGAGTLGARAEVGFEVVPTVVLRGVINKYDYDYNDTIDGIKYDGQIAFGSYGVQVDFHPPLIPLYATVGVFKNDNAFSLTGVPTGTYTIGNNTYTGAQVGTLTSNVGFDDKAIYGGLGLEFQLGPIAAVLEGGVYYQGEPDVVMTATGPIASDSNFIADLNREVASAKQDLDKTKYWPAVTLMGRWKF